MPHPGADGEEPPSPPPPPHYLGRGNEKEEEEEEAEVRRLKKRPTTGAPVHYKETDDDEEDQVEQETEAEDNRKWLRQQQKKKQRMLQARAVGDLQARALGNMTPPNNNHNHNHNESAEDEAIIHVGTYHPRPPQQPPHDHPSVGVPNLLVPPPSVAASNHPSNYVNPTRLIVPTIPYGIPDAGTGTAGGAHHTFRPSEPLPRVPPPLVTTTANALPLHPKVSASSLTNNALPVPKISNSNREIQVQTLHKKHNQKQYKVKVKLLDNTVAAAQNTGISDQIIEAVCREGGGFLKGSWICFHDPKALDIKPREFFQAIPTFDVLSLRPLPIEEVGTLKQWWKRVIELVCKQSQQPIVCFPSIRHACAALLLKPLQVQRACHTYGTHEQFDFRAFMLRYKIKSTVYVYGSHETDFRLVPETSSDRISRWNRLQIMAAETSKSASAGGGGGGGTTTKAPIPIPIPIAMRSPPVPAPTVPALLRISNTLSIPIPIPIPIPTLPKVIINLDSEETDTDESWSQSAAKNKKKKKKPPEQTKKKDNISKEKSGATNNNDERDSSTIDALVKIIAKRKESKKNMNMHKKKTSEEPQESPQECGEWTGIVEEQAAAAAAAAEPKMLSKASAAELEIISRPADELEILPPKPADEPPEMIVREPLRRLIPIGPIQRPGSPRRDDILTDTLKLFSDDFPQRPSRQPTRNCIFCQESPAEIIFEPCGHSVVCKKCATWACWKYCPKCHADIVTRKLGISMFRNVKLDLTRRPQTFSPYHFMDL